MYDLKRTERLAHLEKEVEGVLAKQERKLAKCYEWHEWFAWRPVHLEGGGFTWLTKVERIFHPFWREGGEIGWYTREYRKEVEDERF